jgi:hypothetical protein
VTRSEIIAIQSELGVQADGIWGPITAAAYAARMAHEAPHAPVALPPVSKPWWASRAILGLLATVLASLAGRFGFEVDDDAITPLLLHAVELGGLAVAAWGTIRRSAPIDPTLVARVRGADVRLPVRPNRTPDDDPRGAFRDS